MFRLIRWLCFPIARRLNTFPIAVYFALALSLIAVRTMLRGGPDYLFRLPEPWTAEMDPVLAAWLLPGLYMFALIVFPIFAWLFDRKWFRRAETLEAKDS